ncbi:hypothetical protein, partial [Pseudomonas fragi]|uniref:hypothetical protein n=1 Tax=Pseudomonas fragi TaxID=296 RepID=UPI001CA3C4BF
MMSWVPDVILFELECATTAASGQEKSTRETPNKSPSMLKYSLTTCPECVMSQMSFSDFEYAGKRKQTR